MPLYTRPTTLTTTSFFGSSVEPTSTGRSNRSNLRSFRTLPSYPTPQRRREITTEASTSSFQTSYVICDESDSESSETTNTDISCDFLKKRLLAKGNFKVEDDSSDSDTMKHETISNMSYSTVGEEKTNGKVAAEAFVFSCEGTGSVTCIAAARSGQAWICRNNERLMHLYHRNGHKKETKTLSTKIDTLSVRQDGTILLVPHQSQSINKLASTGKLTDFISFELAPGGICCTSRNETLLTTAHITKSHKKGPRPRKRPSILRLSQTGVIIWEIKTKGTDPLLKPSRIVVNKTGDICVIDQEPARDHVVLFSPDGTEKRRYYGVQNKVLLHPFDPKDLCCDRNGYIYIADLHNSAVHVLDKSGNFVRFLLTRSDGAQFPSALTCDLEGFIWVGFSSGQIRIFNVEKFI